MNLSMIKAPYKRLMTCNIVWVTLKTHTHQCQELSMKALSGTLTNEYP